MFNNLPSPNQEERESQLNPIPYSEAIKRLPKPKNCLITKVSWNDVESVSYETVCFGISEAEMKENEFKVAIEPSLPHGYEMYPHSSWDTLWNAITQRIYNETQPEMEHLLFKQMEDFVDKFMEDRFQSLVNLVNGYSYFTKEYFDWQEENFPLL